MHPLIVGIDPGTTAGIALFDVDGNLVEVTSKRSFSKAAMRLFILEHGDPLVIASDMTPLPKGIETIASSFDARVVTPGRVLRWKDKKRIVESFLKAHGERAWENQHEKDALIAGWYAWKRLRPRLMKMERHGLEPHAIKCI